MREPPGLGAEQLRQLRVAQPGGFEKSLHRLDGRAQLMGDQVGKALAAVRFEAAEDKAPVVERNAALQHPQVLPVAAAQAKGELQRLAGTDMLAHRQKTALAIVVEQAARPAVTQLLLQRVPGEAQPGLVAKVANALRADAPHEAGRTFDEALVVDHLPQDIRWPGMGMLSPPTTGPTGTTGGAKVGIGPLPRTRDTSCDGSQMRNASESTVAMDSWSAW